MSVLFAEMDRSGPVGSVAMNGGCGSSIHNQQPQSQSSSSASSTNSVTAAAVAAAAVAANSLEEQRALQLAFELSMLGLSDSMPGCNSNGGHVGSDLNVNIGLNSVNSGCHQSPSSLSPGGSANGGINSVMTNNVGMSAFSSMMPNMEDRSKKSQNMTECVPVPSSEHVAEIVGRQGCKIKALRAKTNTYIKTPVRGEEPVFVVTGRKEDVAKAKREILSAAEHFSLIRASRKPALGGLSGKGTSTGPPAGPGQVTIQVKVPYRVVGLVVGPKGATIKQIQQQTHTYIVTPSRDKEPVFEVTGQSENVQSARHQIEAHIALRTGNASAALGGVGNGNVLNGLNGGIGSLLGAEDTPELLASLYKNGLGSLFGYLEPNGQQDTFNGMVNCNNGGNHNGNGGILPSSTGSSTCSSTSSSSSSTSSKSAVMTLPELINIWKRNDSSSIEVDEGLGESPNIWSMPTPSIIGSRSSPAASVSPTDSLLASISGGGNGNGMMSNSMTNGMVGMGLAGMNINGLTNNATGGILNNSKQNQQQRECLVCGDKEVTAALVPCGHNMFCLDCANRICSSGDAACPICNETVIQAIRIIA